MDRHATFPPQSFVGGLSRDDVDALFAAGLGRRHRAGDYLCREGDPPMGVVVVLRGSVKLTKTARSGRQAMLELRGPGDVLGDMSVIDSRPQSANAIALGDVDVLAVPAGRFDRLLRDHAAIARSLLAEMVRRLRQASGRQLELGTAEVTNRVCRRLVELAASHGEAVPEGVLVRSSLSQQELADWAGVSRDGVVRALHELRARALVDSGRGRVLIRDIDGLRARAGLDEAESA